MYQEIWYDQTMCISRIRDLSNGSNILAPPPSPGPAYKLAKYRYGKEEMLALFSQTTKPPVVNTDIADFILMKVSHNPLAMQPLTEEEQVRSESFIFTLRVLTLHEICYFVSEIHLDP